MNGRYKETLDRDSYVSNYYKPTKTRFVDLSEEELKFIGGGGSSPGNTKKRQAGQKAAARLRKHGHPDFVQFKKKEQEV